MNAVPATGAARRLSPSERAALGRAARATARRSSHEDIGGASGRDPLALLEDQAATRVPELVPIRYGRMASSPFAYYRGAALPMAADLADTPVSGLRVQACGDAHLLNFGLYNSPERSLVFDVNDFDETLPGPWEWDVKRLAASLVLAGRERGFSRKQRASAVLEAVRIYRSAMAEFATRPTIDVWYARIGEAEMSRLAEDVAATRKGEHVAREGRRQAERAATRTNLQAVASLTRVVDGRLEFVDRPPLIEPLRSVVPDPGQQDVQLWLAALLTAYLDSLPAERRWLMSQYRIVDMARKVVGVGSVGTRCWIVLLIGRDADDPLVLQAKEAQRSVLERYTEPSSFANEGERVVTGQHLVQAASDIVLGWVRASGPDGVPRDFYVRQLRDGKGSVDVSKIIPEGLRFYAGLCGWTLARAHARSGDRIAIAAYLGSSDTFDQALLRFAEAYADRAEHDHADLVAAIAQGRIQATDGV